MVDLSAENKALCFQDSVEKPLTVAIYDLVDNPDIEGDTYYKIVKRITGEQIISESMQFNEGIVDSNTFEFGTFVLPQMKIQWAYEGERYLGKYCVVYQKIGTEYVVYMQGFVEKEKFADNRRTTSATISSILSQRLNANYAYIYNQYTTGEEIVLSDFLQMLVTSGVFFCDVEKAKAKFPVLGLVKFKKRGKTTNGQPDTSDPNAVTEILISDFLKYVGNIIGAHIKIAKHKFTDEQTFINTPQPYLTDEIEFVRIDNVIDMVYPSSTLYPSNTLYPLLKVTPVSPIYELPYFININYDDLENTAYACYKVNIWYTTPSGDFAKIDTLWANPMGAYDAVPAYNFDSTMCDNAFSDIYWSSTWIEYRKYVRNNLCAYLLNSKYVVANLDYTYAPFLEPGDNIRVTTTDGRTIIIPILNCSVSGINALRATVSSEITSN